MLLLSNAGYTLTQSIPPTKKPSNMHASSPCPLLSKLLVISSVCGQGHAAVSSRSGLSPLSSKAKAMCSQNFGTLSHQWSLHNLWTMWAPVWPPLWLLKRKKKRLGFFFPTFFPIFTWNLCISVCGYWLLPFHFTKCYWEEPGSAASPFTLSATAEQAQLSQPLLLSQMCQSLNCLGGPLLSSNWYIPVCLVLGSAEQGTPLLRWSHQCWTWGSGGGDWPLHLLALALPNAAHSYQWPPLPQGAQQDNPQAHFCRACTCYSFSSAGLCISLRWQSRCPSAHVSSLLPSLRAAAQPPGPSPTPLHFVSSANPLWVRLVPSSRSLMEMLRVLVPILTPRIHP